MSGSHLSKDFFDLVKAIGECKSKQEEDRIIVHELAKLKARFLEKQLSKRIIKESLVRMIYVEMLGHDASFGYVHAIQLTASVDLTQKKVGYLCAALTLSPDHEFRFMLVNQLQRDLASANLLDVSTGLIALCKLVTVEMVPALLPSITKLLTHEQGIVRKKAVLALHRIYQLDPHSLEHLTDSLRKVLCDRDPSVMGASLCVLHDLAKDSPQKSKELVSSYVSVLKQIIEHRLPKDFDYHRIPAPWIQIKLLKILATLGQNDQRASESMYEILHECMKHANTGIYVGYAIIYECVRTITTIYPDGLLLDVAADAIARFITSDSHNLKYLGVTGLAAIVRDHPKYAAEHQMVVLDCLEDPDETLKRKTLDLLYRMTNPVNAEIVIQKLIHFLSVATDKFLRQDLVSRICKLAERFAPNNIWYVKTITHVFELGGDMVEAEVAHNLLRLLAEDEEDSELLRIEACNIFFELFEKPNMPEMLLRIIFWTLGEYVYLLGSEMISEVIEVIVEVVSRESLQPVTRRYALTSVMKMCARLRQQSSEANDLMDNCIASVDIDLQHRAYEFKELVVNMETMVTVLPVDASCEDLSDPAFDFLDQFVQLQLDQGAPEYSPPSKSESDSFEYSYDEKESAQVIHAPALKYDAYAKPTLPTIQNKVVQPSSLSYAQPPSVPAYANGLNMQGVKSMWGSSGYSGGALKEAPKPTNDDMAALRNAVNSPSMTSHAAPDRFHEEPKLEPTAPPPAPKAPRPPSERERMAAALFGGVSTDQKPQIPHTARTRPVKQPATPPPSVNLLDFDDVSETPSNTTSSNLLFELDEPRAANTVQASNAVVSDEMDLLGGFMEEKVDSPPFTGHILTTQQFGQNWMLNMTEKKFALAAHGTLDYLTGLLTSQLGVHLVETIPATQEAIFAGTDSSNNSIVLVHAKVRNFVPAGTDFTLRSSNQKTISRALETFQNLH